jgi:regulatory protein YycH of two-component signal transduction system YycFG
MKINYKKEGIGIALGIFVFAVSMVLLNSDGLFINKVLAQGVNSTTVQEPTDKLDQVIAKFKEIVGQNGINVTSLTAPNSSDISEHLQKIIAAKVVAAISGAYNQALEQAGVANTTQGLKEKYAGDLPMLVQKFNELRQNSTK